MDYEVVVKLNWEKPESHRKIGNKKKRPNEKSYLQKM